MSENDPDYRALVNPVKTPQQAVAAGVASAALGAKVGGAIGAVGGPHNGGN